MCLRTAALIVALALSVRISHADVFNMPSGQTSITTVPVGNPADTADAASLLYEQPAISVGGNASQNAPNWFGSLYTAFDDFTLATGASITGVQWQGSYSATPVYPITQFEIIFWSNNAGLPGQALATYDISGNGGEQFVTRDSNGYYECDYGVGLPTAFAASPNTTYWLSIQPTVNGPPQWYWSSGTGGDGWSAEIIRSVSPNPSRAQGDSAFSLTGVAVPEPSTSTLLGIGAAGLAALVWRNTRRRLNQQPPAEPVVRLICSPPTSCPPLFRRSAAG